MVSKRFKHTALLQALDKKAVYSPASVADFAEDNGFLEGLSSKEKALQRKRIRRSLSQFALYHEFPIAGDGLIQVKGQAPSRGWFGSRWQDALSKSE